MTEKEGCPPLLFAFFLSFFFLTLPKSLSMLSWTPWLSHPLSKAHLPFSHAAACRSPLHKAWLSFSPFPSSRFLPRFSVACLVLFPTSLSKAMHEFSSQSLLKILPLMTKHRPRWENPNFPVTKGHSFFFYILLYGLILLSDVGFALTCVKHGECEVMVSWCPTWVWVLIATGSIQNLSRETWSFRAITIPAWLLPAQHEAAP